MRVECVWLSLTLSLLMFTFPRDRGIDRVALSTYVSRRRAVWCNVRELPERGDVLFLLLSFFCDEISGADDDGGANKKRGGEVQSDELLVPIQFFIFL